MDTTTASPREARPYDLVLFGATGFTGKLTAEYLAEKLAKTASDPQQRQIAWALAGRSRAKLEKVRAELSAIAPALGELPILVADSGDEATLHAVAQKTRVICTTVGPYGQHGRGLVAACAEHGTDYCDLTGEVPFIRDSIDRNHARAIATGARIVHCCGFDSLPSDLGVFLLYEHFAGAGQRLAAAKLYVQALKGGPSGGTIASMLSLVDEAKRDPAVRQLMLDPYALYPDRNRDRGPDGRDQLGVSFDTAEGCWTAPFVMAGINARIVRRSNALLDFAYGRDFRYSEVSSFRRGAAGLLRATALAAGVGGVLGLASVDALRGLIKGRLPEPGQGPSKAERDSGYFRIRTVGHSAPDATGKVHHAAVRIEGHHDPGYGETARMLGEASLCLAIDPLARRGGVLTPAVSMGASLIKRLRQSGMRLEIEG